MILPLADVHLGIGTGGAGIEDRAFERAIDFAIEVDVDGVLVAGGTGRDARRPDGPIVEYRTDVVW